MIVELYDRNVGLHKTSIAQRDRGVVGLLIFQPIWGKWIQLE